MHRYAIERLYGKFLEINELVVVEHRDNIDDPFHEAGVFPSDEYIWHREEHEKNEY